MEYDSGDNSKQNKSGADNEICSKRQRSELKTNYILSPPFREDEKPRYASSDNNENSLFARLVLTETGAYHLFTLITTGSLIWGLLFVIFGDTFTFGGDLFRLVSVPILGFVCGQLLERLTTLPALLGQLLVGILLSNLDYMNIRDFPEIDSCLRKIYPVIILGKASIGWDFHYMNTNRVRMLAFGLIPWAVDVMTLAVCTQYFFGFPWSWGFLLGSIFASLSPAVVVPMVAAQRARGLGARQELAKLVGMGGGVDTTISVGMYGLLHFAKFYNAPHTYTVVKASLTLFVGAALGVSWGYLAKFAPHKDDPFVAQLRFLFVFLGGLFANFGTNLIGWGGVGGVAVLLCNVTAATQWTRAGWQLSDNPVATAYRVLWNIFEPMLFSYTGSHFHTSRISSETVLMAVATLAVCLATRLLATGLVGWSCGLSLKERIFMCITWIPKAIVECVLAPAAYDALRGDSTPEEQRLAELNIQLVVVAVLLSTPLGALLTSLAGPRLLRVENDPAFPNDLRESRKMSNSIWSTNLDFREKL